MADAGQMLQRLDTLSRAAPGSPAAPAPKPPISTASFSDLLALVQQGELSDDRPVDISPMLDIELSEGDLNRIAQAVDQAEAAGAERALVMLDGKGLIVDVAARRVEGVVDQPGELMSGIDAVVAAPASNISSVTLGSNLLELPRQLIENQSLLDLLAPFIGGDKVGDESQSESSQS